MSIREQRATIGYTVQSINMALRTGMTVSLAGEAPAAFRELIQLTPEQAAAKSKVSLTPRQRAVQILGRIKLAASFPLALAAFPYVRLRGYKGTYLYCLARLHD